MKYWLAPNQTDRLCDGMDPYAASPAFRLSHVIENGKYDLIETSQSDETYLFGLNGSTKEYAEQYTTSVAAHVYGCYLVTPSFSGRNTLDVDICLYTGKDKPETLVATKKFNPILQYTDGSTSGETSKSLVRSQEHFIAFDTPVEVGSSFFVGYRINNEVNFCTYNIQKGEMTQNSAWIKQGEEWIEASQASGIGFNTALFIDPVVSYYTKTTGNELLASELDIQVNVMRKDKRIDLIFPENPSGAHYRLVDFAGKVIDSQMIHEAQSTWSYPYIPSGIYLLSIQQGDQIFTRKIVF